MEETTGKELVLTPPTGVARRRSKPSLMVMPGTNRLICTDGKFHPDLATDYTLTEGRDRWVTMGEFSRVFVGSNSTDGKRRARRQMRNVFTRLLAHDEFLVYETEPSNGRIQAVKLLDVRSEQERQAARPQLERMRKRHDLSAVKYGKALQVIERKESIAVAKDA